MESLINERLAALQDKSAADLQLLPGSSTEIIRLDNKDINLTVYHDSLDNDRHRVVVQGIHERWGGLTAKVVAKGFEFALDGIKRTLEPEDLYDFT